MTAVSLGGVIYVFASDRTNYKLKYDDPNATWVRLPDRTVTSRKVLSVTLGEEVYVFDNGSLKTAVEKFDTNTSAWSRVTDRPLPASDPALAQISGSIYCIGGWKVVYKDDVFRFEPGSASWDTLPPMPTPRQCSSAVGFDEKIFVTGGYRDGVLQLAECFDTKLKTWTTLADMNYPRQVFNSFVIRGEIYLIGGYRTARNTKEAQNEIEKYDPSRDTWEVVASITGLDIHPLGTVALCLSDQFDIDSLWDMRINKAFVFIV